MFSTSYHIVIPEAKILCLVVFLKDGLLIKVLKMKTHLQKEYPSCQFDKGEYLFSSPLLEMSLNQGQRSFYFLLLMKNQRHKTQLPCPQCRSVYILRYYFHLF